MEIQANAPYSPTTVYGQLTSPLTPKLVTINAHTPYDKVDEETGSKAFSREHFEGKPVAKMKYELPEQELNTEKQKFPPTKDDEEKEIENVKNEVAYFTASSTSNKDIVSNMLKKGYSTDEAVVVQKAQDAYKRSATLTKDPIGSLGKCVYKVS